MKEKSTKTIKEITNKKSIYIVVSIITIIITVILLVRYEVIKKNNLRKKNEECIVSKISSLNNVELIRYHEDSNNCLSNTINEKFSSSAILHSLIDNFAGTHRIYKHSSDGCFQQLMSTSKSIKSEYTEIARSCYKEVYGEEDYKKMQEVAEEIKKDFQGKE